MRSQVCLALVALEHAMRVGTILCAARPLATGFRLLTPLVGQLTPGVATVTKRLGLA